MPGLFEFTKINHTIDKPYWNAKHVNLFIINGFFRFDYDKNIAMLSNYVKILWNYNNKTRRFLKSNLDIFPFTNTNFTTCVVRSGDKHVKEGVPMPNMTILADKIKCNNVRKLHLIIDSNLLYQGSVNVV